MESNGFTMHRLARWAMDWLSVEERRHLTDALASLRGLPPDEWTIKSDNVERRLKGDPPLYLLHFTPQWAAFIQPAADGSIIVDNIWHEERLRLF